jgi:hypothetical protein
VIRPSSFPALNQSPLFESGEAGEYAERGTDRHRAVALALKGDMSLIEMLSDEDREGAEWAVEYIKAHASSGAPLETDVKVSISLQDFTQFEGSFDVASGPDLCDIKWRYRDYHLQMACYALGRFQASDLQSQTMHVLYCESKRALRYRITPQEAEFLVNAVYNKHKAAKRCAISSYCSWCAKVCTCPEYLERVNAVRAGREDWALPNYHGSQLTSPDDMGKALTLARCIKKWADGIEFHATNMMLAGQTPTGFEVATRQSKQYVTDVAKAYSLAGLPQDEFLRCCDVRMNTSKTNAAKVGIVDMISKFSTITKPAARKVIQKNLADVLARGTPTTYLKAIKDEEEETE